jgi:hypothetical protein
LLKLPEVHFSLERLFNAKKKEVNASMSKNTSKNWDQHQVAEIRFLHEQDGAPELVLKDKLREVFRRNRALERAYLVMARLGEETGVVLGLATRFGPEEKIVTTVQAAFASVFNSDEHLDIVFLTDEQETQLTKVCKPFFSV